MILFLVSSGVTTGIGHIRRCAQLAIELKRRKHKVLFCLKHEFGSIEVFKKYNLNSFIISRNDQIQEVLRLYPQIKLIVSDLEDINRVETEKIKSLNAKIKILALDYFDMEDSHVDTIINLCNHNTQLAKPVSRKVRYLEGPSYGILRPEFKSFLRRRKKKSLGVLTSLLISFGGSDPMKHSLNVIPILEDLLADRKCSTTLVIGPNFIHKAEILTAVAKSSIAISAIENPVSMAAFMNGADLCISGSGTTILELAALGTPAIIVPQTQAENNFSTLFVNSGFARMGGSNDGIDRKKMKDALVYFNNGKALRNASAIGQELCDGQGGDRVLGEIELLLKS